MMASWRASVPYAHTTAAWRRPSSEPSARPGTGSSPTVGAGLRRGRAGRATGPAWSWARRWWPWTVVCSPAARIGGFTGDVLGRRRGARGDRRPARLWRHDEVARPARAGHGRVGGGAGVASTASARASGLVHPVARSGRHDRRGAPPRPPTPRRRGAATPPGRPSARAGGRRPGPARPPWPRPWRWPRVPWSATAGAWAVTLPATDLERARGCCRRWWGATGRARRREIARAVVESVAENTVDAVVAPAFWGALAGAPGALGYRAVNTLDAMVGHRSPRTDYGWASARLDDALAWFRPGSRRRWSPWCAPERRGRVGGGASPGARPPLAERGRGRGGVRRRAGAAARRTNRYDGRSRSARRWGRAARRPWPTSPRRAGCRAT